MNKMNIKEKVKTAIETLLSKDAWLLKNDLSEWSITHKLAEYLQPLFSEYNVDCEYNGNVERDGGRKRICVLKGELRRKNIRLSDAEKDEIDTEFADRAVFPDIIVHRRGTNDYNLCIIEVKKSTNTTSPDYDEIKLKAYTTGYYGNDLKYEIGIFIEFVTRTADIGFKMKYFINGEEVNE